MKIFGLSLFTLPKAQQLHYQSPLSGGATVELFPPFLQRFTKQAIIGRSEFLRGARQALPMLLGFIPFALVLGARATHKGLGIIEVPLMTGSNFAGGSEFAAIELWTSPPHVFLIMAITFLINSRHLLMGATLAPYLRHLPRRKALAALFLMCDESWALSLADAKQREAQSNQGPAFSMFFYLGASLALYLSWAFFTTLGAALGPVLDNIETYGFQMAFPAVFLVLLRGMWKGSRTACPWVISLVVAAVAHLLLPGAWYVPLGALSGLIAAYAIGGRA